MNVRVRPILSASAPIPKRAIVAAMPITVSAGTPSERPIPMLVAYETMWLITM